MNNITRRRFANSLLIATALIVGCDRRVPPGTPAPLLPPPPAPAPGPAPNITGVSPATGSTGGGASLQIVGTNFRGGASAVFDGVVVVGRLSPALTALFVETPPHAEGAIDIEVRNQDGTSARRLAAHTYVSPSSFDFSGAWGGFPGNGDDRWMEFTIDKGRLVRAICTTNTFGSVSIPLNGDVAVRGGAFSVIVDERSVLSGRIVSDGEALGTMQFDTCSTEWRAERLATPRTRR